MTTDIVHVEAFVVDTKAEFTALLIIVRKISDHYVGLYKMVSMLPESSASHNPLGPKGLRSLNNEKTEEIKNMPNDEIFIDIFGRD